MEAAEQLLSFCGLVLCASQLPGNAGLGVVLFVVTSVVASCETCVGEVSDLVLSGGFLQTLQTWGYECDQSPGVHLLAPQSTCPKTTCELPLYQQGSLCEGCDIKCVLSLGVSSPVPSVYSYPGCTKTVFVSNDMRQLYKK